MNYPNKLIQPLLFLLFVVILVDTAAQYIVSDFWNHPLAFTTKLGIFSTEILNTIVISSILFLPVVFTRYSKSSFIQYGISFTLISVLFTFLVSSWVFYTLFERFLGKFAFQMLVQDGGQILSFAQIMPAVGLSINLLILFCLILFTTFLSISKNKVAIKLQTFSSYLVIAFIIAAVPLSILYNQPPVDNNYQVAELNSKLARAHAVEYDLLLEKSGPFTAIASDIASVLAKSQNKQDSVLSGFAMNERTNSKSAFESFELINQDPLNIVLIMVESLRKDRLAAYAGNPEIMPTVNRLSENAYVFKNLWAQSSHSNYADIATISGQYPLRSENIHFYPKNPDYPRSRPYDILGPLGYASGFFSSQNEHWGQMSNYLNSSDLSAFSHVGSAEITTGDKLSDTNTGIIAKKGLFDFSGFMYRATGQAIQRLDQDTIHEATNWLQGIPKQQAFGLFVNLQASHAPFNALPKDFKRKFLTENSKEAEEARSGNLVGKPITIVEQAYNDSLNYVDQNIAQLISTIESRTPNRTVYLITADTSMQISQSLVGNGGKLFKEVLEIPVILYHPALNAQIISNVIGGQIDLMPTALSLLGYAPHPASQGINLLGKEDNRNRPIFSVAQTPVSHQYSAILDDWQLVFDNDSSQYQLHYFGNLTADRLVPLSEDKTQLMVRLLNTWISAQLEYYSDANIQKNYYPPRYRELLKLTNEPDNVSQALLY